MGAKNTLDYLHQMGFKTFNDFWDETYDGYADADRYFKILDLIRDLSKLSLAQLKTMYQSMQPVLQHNLNLLKNKNFKTAIQYIK